MGPGSSSVLQVFVRICLYIYLYLHHWPFAFSARHPAGLVSSPWHPMYPTPCIQVLVKPMERCVCKSLCVLWVVGGWVQFSLSSACDAWVVTPILGAATDVACWVLFQQTGLRIVDWLCDRNWNWAWPVAFSCMYGCNRLQPVAQWTGCQSVHDWSGLTTNTFRTHLT